MKKLLRKVGNSLGFTFSKEEQEIYKLSDGMVVELEIKNG